MHVPISWWLRGAARRIIVVVVDWSRDDASVTVLGEDAWVGFGFGFGIVLAWLVSHCMLAYRLVWPRVMRLFCALSLVQA